MKKHLCEVCGSSFTRMWDLKRHSLKAHGIEPGQSYRRWGVDVDDDETDVSMTASQGTKRSQASAGIKNVNPHKVSRVEKPEQSGQGKFVSWK